ncbi:unnamed protein product [Cercospora beticola]|nr:unnamed protein product [Cercospora beticola]
MKFSASVLLAVGASAFPAKIMEEAIKRDPELVAKALEAVDVDMLKRQAGAGGATALFEPVPKFNAATQFINVGPGSGHEWQAPGPNDQRGPCPGLNAFANHGCNVHRISCVNIS